MKIIRWSVRGCITGLAVTAALAMSMGLTPAAPRPGPDVAAAAIGGNGPQVQSIAGFMEFSGRLVARPVQPGQGALRGMDAAEIAARSARARQALAPIAIAHYPEVDEFVIPVPAGQTEPEAIARMMATGDYQYVTPDWICFPTGQDIGPDDPLYENQWHHEVMQSYPAWHISQGRAEQPFIVCAFVDTGIDLAHPDLVSRLVFGYNSVTGMPQDFGGDVTDINGHGTRVAGSAAAVGNNAIGVAGIGWNLRIMPIRTSNSTGGGAFMSNILAGARWAAENGARVISASYTGVSDPTVQTTGEYIRSLNKIFCFAAGNNGADLPFTHPHVVVVAATGPEDALAGFSAYGQAITVGAPGVGIWTTSRGGGYDPASGTSFATPIANGVLGMIWSVNPALTADQVVAIMRDSADAILPPGQIGSGRVNLLRALRSAAQTLGPLPPYAVGDAATALLGATVDLDVLANDFHVHDVSFTLAAAPASSDLGGSISILPGAGPEGRAVIRYTAPAGATGDDAFLYTIQDVDDRQAVGVVRIRLLDPAMLRPAVPVAASRPGLLTGYYALPELNALPDYSTLSPYATEVVPQVNFPSTDGDFAGSGRADNVGAVFTGFVRAPVPDEYTFFTSSDDGSRLLIGQTLVVDNDGLHGMQERSGTIALHAGWHPIRIEFFERGGGAGLIASIRGGGLSKQVIPAALLRESSCTADWNHDAVVSSADLSQYIAQWLADLAASPGTAADINGDGVVNSLDISAFVTAWLSQVGGC